MTNIKKNKIDTELFGKKIISDNLFDSYINRFRKSLINTSGLIELYTLSHIFPYPIIVYDNYNNIKFTFENGKMNIKVDVNQNTIFIKFNYKSMTDIPYKVYSLYLKN